MKRVKEIAVLIISWFCWGTAAAGTADDKYAAIVPPRGNGDPLDQFAYSLLVEHLKRPPRIVAPGEVVEHAYFVIDTHRRPDGSYIHPQGDSDSQASHHHAVTAHIFPFRNALIRQVMTPTTTEETPSKEVEVPPSLNSTSDYGVPPAEIVEKLITENPTTESPVVVPTTITPFTITSLEPATATTPQPPTESLFDKLRNKSPHETLRQSLTNLRDSLRQMHLISELVSYSTTTPTPEPTPAPTIPTPLVQTNENVEHGIPTNLYYEELLEQANRYVKDNAVEGQHHSIVSHKITPDQQTSRLTTNNNVLKNALINQYYDDKLINQQEVYKNPYYSVLKDPVIAPYVTQPPPQAIQQQQPLLNPPLSTVLPHLQQRPLLAKAKSVQKAIEILNNYSDDMVKQMVFAEQKEYEARVKAFYVEQEAIAIQAEKEAQAYRERVAALLKTTTTTTTTPPPPKFIPSTAAPLFIEPTAPIGQGLIGRVPYQNRNRNTPEIIPALTLKNPAYARVILRHQPHQQTIPARGNTGVRGTSNVPVPGFNYYYQTTTVKPEGLHLFKNTRQMEQVLKSAVLPYPSENTAKYATIYLNRAKPKPKPSRGWQTYNPNSYAPMTLIEDVV